MRKTCRLFILWSAFLLLPCQLLGGTFSKSYNPGVLFSIDEGPDGSLYSAGVLGGNLSVLKLSGDGVLRFQKSLATGHGMDQPSIIVDQDGSYLVGGGKWGGIWPNYASALLARFSKNDALSSATSWSLFENSTVYATCKRPGGGMAMVLRRWSRSYQDHDIVVVLTDPRGAVEWQISYDNEWPFWEYVNSIAPAADGYGYILAGTALDADEKQHKMLIYASSIGTPWWAAVYGPGMFSSAVQDGDGNFVAVGQGLAQKVDGNGAIVWQKKSGCDMAAIERLNDGNFLVAGSSGGKPWLGKMTSGGEILWEKTYASSGFIKSAKEASDGQILLAGSVSGAAWVGRADQNGFIQTCAPSFVTTANSAWVSSADPSEWLFLDWSDAWYPGNAIETTLNLADVSTSTSCACEENYDSTILVQSAVYEVKKDTLRVISTTDLGEASALTLEGFGNMLWEKSRSAWTIAVTGLGANPGTVTIKGIEGTATAEVSSD